MLDALVFASFFILQDMFYSLEAGSFYPSDNVEPV